MPPELPSETALLDEIQQLRARVTSLELAAQIPNEIIEKAPVMISVVRAPDFIYELVNPAYQALAPGKEFLGRRFVDVWPEVIDPLIERLQKVIATGQAFYLEDAQYRIQRGPGLPTEEVYISYSCVPLFNSEGKPDRVLTLAREVTGVVRQRQQLQQSLERLERVLTVETVGVVFWDLNSGCLVDANSAFFKLLGYSRGEVGACELTWQALTPPEYMEVSREVVEELLTTGRGGPYEKEYLCKDGTRRWILFASNSLGNDHVVEFCVDISARKTAEAALRESELRLRTVIEEAPLAIALTGTSGEILLRNPRFDELWGRPPHVTTASTYSEVYEGYHLDGRPIASEEWPGARAVLKGEIIENEIYEIVTASGTRITCWFGAIPLRSAYGEIMGAVVVFRDVTEERRTEAALRESEERLTLAVEGAGMGTWDVDWETGLSRWSDRYYEMLGYPTNPENKATLEMWRSRVYPADLAAVDPQIEQSRVNGRYASEHRIVRADDGEIRWLSEFGQVVRNEAGEPYRFVGVSFDVTGRKRTEQDLLRANRDLEQFAYSASHDLREPLRTVAIFSELLRKRSWETLSPESRGFLQNISDAVRRMDTLVNDLLSYAKAGMLESQVSLEDAGASLNAALANLSAVIAESKVTVSYASLPSLPVHAAHLQQLFQNLIGNAIKFRRPDVPLAVKVSAEEQSGQWHFVIEDNGIGIDPKFQEQIFGLFRRLHSKEVYDGTGIGLALCQRIVEHYDGRIWVESKLGQGSTFHFTLPA